MTSFVFFCFPLVLLLFFRSFLRLWVRFYSEEIGNEKKWDGGIKIKKRVGWSPTGSGRGVEPSECFSDRHNTPRPVPFHWVFRPSIHPHPCNENRLRLGWVKYYVQPPTVYRAFVISSGLYSPLFFFFSCFRIGPQNPTPLLFFLFCPWLDDKPVVSISMISKDKFIYFGMETFVRIRIIRSRREDLKLG